MIEIGGLTLHEKSSDDWNGWGYSDLVDWYSVPQSKSEIRERPAADWAFGIAEDFRSSLAISFTGFYKGASEADALMAQRALKRALGRRTPRTITVTDALGATSRIVSVRAAPVRPPRGRTVLQFAVDMIAPDANRYGPAVSVSTGLPTAGGGISYPITYPINYGEPGNPGRLIAVNPGTEDSVSLLEVTGGLSGGFELTEVHSGRVLRFERPVAIDSTIFLNPRTGRVYVDAPGNDVSGFLTRREWWPVPAEGSTEIQFTALGVVTGTPILTARTAPAY